MKLSKPEEIEADAIEPDDSPTSEPMVEFEGEMIPVSEAVEGLKGNVDELYNLESADSGDIQHLTARVGNLEEQVMELRRQFDEMADALEGVVFEEVGVEWENFEVSEE